MFRSFFSFLLLFLIAGLPAAPQAPPLKTVVKKDLLFDAVERNSSRFPDQVDSDQANRQDQVWTLDILLKAEAKPEAWRKARKLISGALAKVGLVPVRKADLDRLPRMHRVELPIVDDPDDRRMALRPRDQASFAALMADVEVLGDREVGRRTYALRNYFLVVEALDFEFTPRGCWMKLRLQNLVIGCLAEEDGKKEEITDGELIEESDLITRKLAARLRELLDSSGSAQ
jgi:hypothetical protein